MNIATHLLIISGPSGVGKSTLVRALLEQNEALRASVSYTTRALRGRERDGEHYHFISREAFEVRRAADEFAESAEVHGNLYGTSRQAIASVIAAGHDLVFDVDVQGARQLRESYPGAWSVMIAPPNIEGLARRLAQRGTDSEAVQARRMAQARWELSQAGSFEFQVTNDDLECSIGRLASIYQALCLRVHR